MNYKIKQLYPGLPKNWIVGTELAPCMNRDCYSFYRAVDNKLIVGYVHKDSAENYPDFFEKVNYSAITEDGIKVKIKDTVYWVNNCNNKWKYCWSTLLCQGHLDTTLKNKSYKMFSSKEAAEEFIQDNNHKPFLRTEDGVDKFIGDTVHTVVLPLGEVPYIMSGKINASLIRPASYVKDFNYKHNAEACVRQNTKVEISIQELYDMGYKLEGDMYKLFQNIYNKVARKLGNSI